MNAFIQKLTSRKLWAMVAGLATGFALIRGVDLDQIARVAGGLINIVSVMTYIITEGAVDVARTENAPEQKEAE